MGTSFTGLAMGYQKAKAMDRSLGRNKVMRACSVRNQEASDE